MLATGSVPPASGGSGSLGSSSSPLLLSGLLVLLRLDNMLLPEAGYHIELRNGSSRCTECCIDGALALEQLSVALLESFLLLDSLSMQNGQAEVQVAQLLVVTLSCLLKLGILCAKLGQKLGFGRGRAVLAASSL